MSSRRPDPNATPMQGTNRTELLGVDDAIQKPQVSASRVEQIQARALEGLRAARARIADGFHALSQRARTTRSLRAITADEITADEIMALLAVIALLGVMLSVLIFWRLAECRTAPAAGDQETFVECLIPGR